MSLGGREAVNGRVDDNLEAECKRFGKEDDVGEEAKLQRARGRARIKGIHFPYGPF